MREKLDRLQRQLDFILELDKLKTVLRQTSLVDGSRQETSSDHSWHIATMALLLLEHADEEVDLLRVLKMLLVHDVVEIDAGDTFCYDTQAVQSQRQREEEAAQRLFGLLPDDQRDELEALWEEFEQRASPEARFAGALDRFQAVLLNHATGGGSWRLHGISVEQVTERNQPIGEGSTLLWNHVRKLLDDAVERRLLVP
jgi:putative hydrolase of HD superfamily